MNKLCTLFLLLLIGTVSAQAPVLVKDINTGTANGFPDNKEQLVSIGSVVYFSADDGINGAELWRSDGTEFGTFMIKDIQPGNVGSAPIWFSALSDKVLFLANDGIHGDELWVSDGTESGTKLLKDINPGVGSCNNRLYLQFRHNLLIINDILYFTADDGTNFSQLWRSDGTVQGTYSLGNICPTCGSVGIPSGQFTSLNDTLYFVVLNNQLWRSDGTISGTAKVFEAPDVLGLDKITKLKGLNGSLYFGGSNPTNLFLFDLWKSDGTVAGTSLVYDLAEPLSTPRQFVEMGSKMYFISGYSLWSTDGTEAGTHTISSLTVDVAQQRNNLYVWKDELYFRAKGPDNKSYIYKTDGSINGEAQVYTQNFQSVEFIDPIFYASSNDYLFYDGLLENPLSVGVARINQTGSTKELLPVGSLVEYLYIAGDNLFFRGKTNDTGEELWKLSLVTSATKSPDQHLSVNIYPTISQNGLYHLDYNDSVSSRLEINVYDVFGKQVYKNDQFSGETIRLTMLPAGTYLVRITNEAGQFAVQKVIKG